MEHAEVSFILESTAELSERVRRGLELIQEGRTHVKPMWGVGLTVLDDTTAELPLVIRKAMAEKKVLSEMPIRIEGHELVVGLSNPNSFLGGSPFPEFATAAEKKAATERFTGVFSVFGHFCPSYSRFLRLGVGGLLAEAVERGRSAVVDADDPATATWYEALTISLEGLQTLIGRYSDLAAGLAAAETDPARRWELETIAGATRTLMHDAPQSFHEAVQAVWFANIAFQSTKSFQAVGRLDQFLWPFLQRDLERGAITLPEAQEIVDCLWLKWSEKLQSLDVSRQNVYFPFDPGDDLVSGLAGFWGLYLGGRTSQELFGAAETDFQMWQLSVTLSGLTPEGVDGTSPMTYLCLNAVHRLRLPQPTVYVRLHEDSPPELLEKLAACISDSAGASALNDRTIIAGMVKQGIPLHHARDYATDGCWECHIQGRTHYKFGFISALESLERALFPGRWDEHAEARQFRGADSVLDVTGLDPFADIIPPDPLELGSFEELFDSFKAQLEAHIAGFVRVVDQMFDGRLYDIAPLPLLSTCTEGPMETGRDITRGGMEYAFHAPCLAGLSHAADSLAVIKKLCFEDGVVSLAELLQAVRDDWAGAESLRHLARTRVPAYGNDDDYVDDLAVEIASFFADTVRKHVAASGTKVKFPPALGSFEFYTVLGEVLPASPDGRRAGEPISSNASPSVGRATQGQTAAMRSYLKLPLDEFPTGAPLDLAMDPGASHLLVPLIKAFVELGGNLLTVNITDVKKLRAAMEEPEKYMDLKIRVGGYEAYFVDLPREFQLWQIEKHEQYER